MRPAPVPTPTLHKKARKSKENQRKPRESQEKTRKPAGEEKQGKALKNKEKLGKAMEKPRHQVRHTTYHPSDHAPYAIRPAPLPSPTPHRKALKRKEKQGKARKSCEKAKASATPYDLLPVRPRIICPTPCPRP